ncbi:MAG: electron transfer flavoprotein subunit alpha/FixB family protein [Proteobacteria bacterium]|nr:electron transfer flavoprotein subunit alpha/FixB family protein [Pseudomonadota bacterium]
MSILVIAEHEKGLLKPSTLGCVTAAKQLNKPIVVGVFGQNVETIVKEASYIEAVQSILHIELAEPLLAEPFSKAIVEYSKDISYILAPATTFGKNVLPRVAALLNVMQVSDVTQIIDEQTFERPIYAGNAFIKVRSSDPVKVMTIRPTSFDKCRMRSEPAKIETKVYNSSWTKTRFMKKEEHISKRPELTSARIIISGGRALGSAENFQNYIESLADQLQAAVGATRAAVDAGYAPNDYQVGQTGKVVAPDLYIAIGISGALQHLAGMKESKVIVAINKDPDAPIFQVADYGLVGDLFEIIPELTQALLERKHD